MDDACLRRNTFGMYVRPSLYATHKIQFSLAFQTNRTSRVSRVDFIPYQQTVLRLRPSGVRIDKKYSSMRVSGRSILLKTIGRAAYLHIPPPSNQRPTYFETCRQTLYVFMFGDRGGTENID